MNELIIVCVRGVKPWAICQSNTDKTEHAYYSIVSRYESYTEAVRMLQKSSILTDVLLKNVPK